MIAPLLDSWRAEAALFERRGLLEAAALLRSCIEDLETREYESEREVLTVRQAAHESGYAISTIRAKIRKGELPNVGGPRSPRVMRRALAELRDGGRVQGLALVEGGERAHG